MPNTRVPAADGGLPQSRIDDQFEEIQLGLYRARCMALILGESLEDALSPGFTRADEPDWFLIDRSRREVIDFASNNTLERLVDLEKAFDALVERFHAERAATAVDGSGSQ